MHYVFDIKTVSGGYAYYGVFTHCETLRDRYEVRVPSEVEADRIAAALAELRLPVQHVDSERSYRRWLYVHGWAIVERAFARELMPQWLAKKTCISTPLGSFTDTELCAPSILGRGIRGRRRQMIIERDGGKCLLCDQTEMLTMQHVLPYSRGGETGWRNLVTLCEPCNQKLGDGFHRDLYELADLPYGVEPHVTKYSDHGHAARLRGLQLSSNLMYSRCEV